MSESLMRIALRTAGRLLARGVFTLPEAAAFIRWPKRSDAHPVEVAS